MKESLPLTYKEQVRQISDGEYELEYYNILDKNGNCIAQMMANAPAFVEACNNYEALAIALVNTWDNVFPTNLVPTSIISILDKARAIVHRGRLDGTMQGLSKMDRQRV